jgi:1,4-dihydroxy-2-naphthoyl-CoA hydrolase
MADLDPAATAAYINQHRGGWNQAMDLTFVRVSVDECVAELTVGPQHRQPYGIVHGGVHAGIIEAACSTGAAVVAMARGQTVVGLENSTSFIRAARGGVLRVTARPLTRGRRTQVWDATVTDADGAQLATGRVRLMCLDAGADLAGQTAGMAPDA